jgi:hypothetical protein
MLPYTLVSLKVLAIQIVLAQSARPVISPAISHKDPANKPASEVLSSWSPLASLFCDYINSVGHFPSLSSSDPVQGLFGEFSSSSAVSDIDEDFYLQSLLNHFPGVRTEQIPPSLAIVRQLLCSSELATRIGGNLSLQVTNLIISFVCIARQVCLFLVLIMSHHLC